MIGQQNVVNIVHIVVRVAFGMVTHSNDVAVGVRAWDGTLAAFYSLCGLQRLNQLYVEAHV
jgi:hypothetical protein